MSLMRTLARVAVGVAAAKGAKSLSRNARAGRSGTVLDDLMNRGGSGRSMGSGSGMGGLGGLLDGLQGRSTKQRRTGQSGGLSDILGSLAGAGGIGGLLGGLAGSSQGNQHGTPAQTGSAMPQRSGQRPGDGFGRALETQFDSTPGTAATPTPEQEELAAVMLLAMVQAAQADGHLDDTERGRIMDHLQDATPDERAFVERAMTQRMQPAELAARVPAGTEAQVYGMSLMAIDLDHPAEVDFLRAFAEELGLDRDTVNDIHAQAGTHPLYS